MPSRLPSSATSATGFRFNNLDISNNTIYGSTNAVSFQNQFVQGQIDFSGNFTSGAVSFAGLTGNIFLLQNVGLTLTAAQLPAGAINGSQVYVSDGTPATACTGAGTGSNGYRQNSAWKCF